MNRFKIGDRVVLKESALSLPYVVARRCYTSMYKGKAGRVIGYAITGKVAIEFDERVFLSDTITSSHDTGCHNKGKKHYCWYIPEVCISLEETVTNNESNLLLLL